MKELAKLAEWIGEVAQIAEDIQTWRHGACWSKAESHELERAVGWRLMFRVVPQPK
jgi:hypothetical protein